MYLLINQRFQHHIVILLLLHKFHFELALSPRRYVDVVGIHLKTIVAPERIEIFHWNFGNIFFDSFTNNLWHRKKFDFLSNLNLFPPLIYSKRVLKLKWFFFYFWFVIRNNFQKKMLISKDGLISSLFQNIKPILRKDK